MMFTGLFVKDKKQVVMIAVIAFLALLGITIWEVQDASSAAPAMLFNNMLRIDSYALWFNMMMAGCTFLYVLLMGKDIMRVGNHVAEYFTLILFILCGIFLLTGYNNLLMLFIGIEIMSIPQYILAGADRRNLKSNEASLKYFLMGAFTTGLLLMGITLLYGATGSFYITASDFIERKSSFSCSLTARLMMKAPFSGMK